MSIGHCTTLNIYCTRAQWPQQLLGIGPEHSCLQSSFAKPRSPITSQCRCCCIIVTKATHVTSRFFRKTVVLGIAAFCCQ